MYSVLQVQSFERKMAVRSVFERYKRVRSNREETHKEKTLYPIITT